MKLVTVIFFVFLVWPTCLSKSIFEPEKESVVSVYTTLPTTVGTRGPLDVYHQIANNLAERITSPIYSLFGIGRNKSEDQPTTKRSFSKIELEDEIPEELEIPDVKPVSNDISKIRDVEELSLEALRRSDKKPEKITLYSSYLPVNSRYEVNDTENDIDNDDDNFDFDFSDVEETEETPREGVFIFFLEYVAGLWQLISGYFSELFHSAFRS